MQGKYNCTFKRWRLVFVKLISVSKFLLFLFFLGSQFEDLSLAMQLLGDMGGDYENMDTLSPFKQQQHQQRQKYTSITNWNVQSVLKTDIFKP